MSFILDALKKSENERQQQTGPEFASVPSRSEEPRAPRWLWWLAGLLIINVIVLLWLLLRGTAEPTATTAPANVPDAAAPQDAAQNSFAERVAAARQNLPPPVATQPDTSSPNMSQPEPTRSPGVATVQSVSAAPENLKSFAELRAEGVLQLRDLHLDIHVFSGEPADRFVFINMTKHREQSRLEEGPVVREINPLGVVLEHEGHVFLLPRQ